MDTDSRDVSAGSESDDQADRRAARQQPESLSDPTDRDLADSSRFAVAPGKGGQTVERPDSPSVSKTSFREAARQWPPGLGTAVETDRQTARDSRADGDSNRDRQSDSRLAPRQTLTSLSKGPARTAVSLFRMRRGKGGSRQLQSYTFLRASESNVRHWRLALGARGSATSRALLLRCFACARQRWQPAASRASFLRASESNVRQLPAAWPLPAHAQLGNSRALLFR